MNPKKKKKSPCVTLSHLSPVWRFLTCLCNFTVFVIEQSNEDKEKKNDSVFYGENFVHQVKNR